jgi:gliding motility-associated-like protein
MKKITITALPLLLFSFFINAQTTATPHEHEFDVEKAYQEAAKKGIPESDRKGYVEKFLKPQFMKLNNKEFNYTPEDRTMRVNLTPHINNANCPNAEFEQLDFTNWTSNTGSISFSGTVTWGGTGSYGPTNSVPNTSWSADIMTTPPGNNNPGLGPVVGYDPIAINPVTNLADIPLVSPTGGTSSVRLGNEQVGAITERVIYSMLVSPANAQFTYQYAVVLQDPQHALGQQPYFKVTMMDGSGNLLTGCGQYQIDATQASADTSYILIDYGGQDLYYKKWTVVSVDLSAYIGQTITIEFQTADCSQTGHFGYAYIDGSCGIIQGYVNGYCTGSTQVLLTAPAGFTAYQWLGPNNTTPISGATNDSMIVNNPNLNDTFFVQMANAAGCTTVVMTIITPSTLQVSNISMTPTCPGGASGSASVTATGGLVSGYNFIWSTGQGGTGTILGTSQTVTGLPQDTAWVNVTSGNCPQKDTFIVLTSTPPPPQVTTLTFCNTSLQLAAPSTGVNYQWYDPFNFPYTPNGNNDSLLVIPQNGQVWSVGWNDSVTGCRDSARFVLSQSTFNVNAGVTNACFGGTNGINSFNATSGFGPYNYNISGPNSYTNTMTTASTLYIISALAPGTYTAVITTSQCYDSLVFTVGINPPVTTNTTKNFCSSTVPLTLVAPNTSGQTNYQWYDSAGNAVGGTPGANDSLTVSTPANGNVYAVTYTTTAGCRDSMRITLTQSIFNVTAAGINSCHGGATGIGSFNAPSGGFAPFNYNVTGPNSFTSTATTSSTIYQLNNLSPGTYTTIVTTPNGCYDSLTFVVNESAMPLANQSVNSCSSSMTLVAPNTTGQNNYQWYNSSGTLISGAAGTNDSLILSNPATGQVYAVTYFNANGCQDSLRVTVTNNPINSIPITLASCYGGTTGQIQATAVTNGTSPYQYSISGPAVQSSSSTATSFTFTPLPAGTYTLTVSSNSGTCVYDSVVTVSQGTVTTTTALDSICPGDTTTFTSAVSGATHQWYGTTGNIITGATSATLSLSPAGFGVYTDTLADANGCISVYKLTVSQVQFNSAVTSTINNPCYQDSVGQITIGSTGGNGVQSFTWNGPGGFAGTGASQDSLNSGIYTVYTKSGNCKDTVTITLTEPGPLADTLAIMTSYCEGDTSAILAAPPGFTNYQWYYNGIELTGLTNDSIFILNPSTSANFYSVTYMVPPCERKTIVIYHSVPPALFTPDMTTNIFTPNGDNKNDYFHPFYNPYVNQAYIEYVEDGYTMKVFDRWGILVFESSDYSVQWNGKNKNGKECPDGTYFWMSTYKSRCGVGEITSSNGFVQLMR